MMKRFNVLFLALAAILALGGVFTACSEPEEPTQSFKVTFVDPIGNGSENDPITLDMGNTLGDRFPVDPVSEDATVTFYGWFEGATQYFPDTRIGANITLTARWVKEFELATVTFAFTQTNGSGQVIQPTAAIDSVKVLKGYALGPLLPAAPRSEGFVFSEWNLDGSPYTNTVINTDITLTAVWAAAQTFLVSFSPGPGATPISPITVYENECIDEWGTRFPPNPSENSSNAAAFFVAWLDNENRVYDGRTVISRNVTLTGRWGLPPYIVNFRTDIAEVQNHDGTSEGTPSFQAVVKEAWDSTAAKPKWVVVNNKTYDYPDNTNRWKILYRIKFNMPNLDTGFYTRYTIRARFYANKQGAKSWTDTTAFTPNKPADAAGYSQAGLLHGVNSPSDDGWGQISWTGVANWDGQGASEQTMLQRYNLDRKGGTINDTWAPLRYTDLKYPPYLIIQTSDAYIGHIEVTQIVFHNGEKIHTIYEDEELEE